MNYRRRPYRVPAAPVADFSADVRIGTFPLAVQFTNLSTNNPYRFLWDFGDGETSTEENPSHTYAGPGPYDVTLTAYTGGGSDSETKLDYIGIPTAIRAASNYWRLDGSDLSDRKGTATLSTSGTPPTSTAGQIGNAATFDGAGNYTAADQAALRWTGDRTLWFWANIDVGIPNFAGFCEKQTYAPSFHVYQNVGNKFRVFTTDTDTLTIPCGSAGAWHLYVVTFAAGGGGVIDVYIDNALATNGHITGVGTMPDTTGQPFLIGNASTGVQFLGQMQSMGLAPSVLSSRDRAWLWNGGAGVQVF